MIDPVAIDFFCGAGGASKGFLDAGFNILAGFDNDTEYRPSFNANIVNRDGTAARFHELDLLPLSATRPGGQRSEAFAAVAAAIEGQDGPLAFIFCPPCQPFTSVNRGKLSADMEELRKSDRNLFYHSLPYIRQFLPHIVFCENVSGIQDRKYGGVWQNFGSEISSYGYEVFSDVVDVADFGIAQSRRRSIMLAIRSDCYVVSDDGYTLPVADPNAEYMTVRQAIGHLPPLSAGATDPNDPDHRAANVSDINRRRLQAAPEGGTNEHFMGTDLEIGCHARLRDRLTGAGRSGGYTDAYTRLYSDRPAPTITTKAFSFSNGRFGHYDLSQDRALSIREAACLQSFPDGYRFHADSIASAARMVGNAVPPRLARFFAKEALRLVGYET